jgi:HAD superfamily hydrolase (TIGR01509 family)
LATACDNAEVVVFDLDGTLVETEQLWSDERRQFTLAEGGQWSPDAGEAMIGMSTAEWSRYMHDTLGVPLAPEAIAQRVTDRMVARLRAGVPVLPGADAVLARLAAAFRLGLASSATRAVLDVILATTGWDRIFAVAVSADEVAHGKPAADVYLRALALLGNPPRAVGIEDSANGIRSARAADLRVIAVPNRAFPPSPDVLALASLVVSDLAAIDVATVRALLT